MADPDRIDYAYDTAAGNNEVKRLGYQSALSAEGTERWLRNAGVREGSTVIEVGCGSGDATAIAARVVGPSGVVLAFDRDAAMVDIARQRLGDAGHRNVTIEQAELNELPVADGSADAVVGRLVLMYQPDPVATVRKLAGAVRHAGSVAFMEFSNLPLGHRRPGDEFLTHVEAPLLRKAFNWVHLAVMQSGTQPLMGLRLLATFADAGLMPDKNFTSVPWITTDFAPIGAAQVRGVLPRIIELGIATADEVDIDTFETRLEADIPPYTIVDAGALIGAHGVKQARGK